MRVVEACNSKNEIVLEPLKHATASGKSLASRSTKGKAKECKRDDKRKLVIASLVGLAPLASQAGKNNENQSDATKNNKKRLNTKTNDKKQPKRYPRKP